MKQQIIYWKTNLGRFAGGPTAGGKPDPAANDTEDVAFDFSAYDELVSSINTPSALTGSVTKTYSVKKCPDRTCALSLLQSSL